MTVIDATSADIDRRHAAELTRFATGLVGPSDAADVVSEAMTRLMTSRIWKDAASHRALMFRAVLYEAKMFHRSPRRRLVREARAATQEPYEMPSIEPEVARWSPGSATSSSTSTPSGHCSTVLDHLMLDGSGQQFSAAGPISRSG